MHITKMDHWRLSALYPCTDVFEKVYRTIFKVRDDDLSSKQGSLFTFKMIIIKIIQKYFKVYIYIYLYLL